EPRLPGLLAGQAEAVSAAIAPGVPPPVMARALIAWTQLFGMISFELFGQLVGSADPSDDFFSFAVDEMADLVGLPA
ncbi:MAG TPA: TetR-like C-terminal domain-containing protein, partial [Streptosporangiaceae bacterium]|nr:TetR-like C-terminal domain-containing protein [Streptosporangiaceae bacterium]